MDTLLALINNTGARPARRLTACVAPISGINLPDTIKTTQIQVFPSGSRRYAQFKAGADAGQKRSATAKGQWIGFDIFTNDD